MGKRWQFITRFKLFFILSSKFISSQETKKIGSTRGNISETKTNFSKREEMAKDFTDDVNKCCENAERLQSLVCISKANVLQKNAEKKEADAASLKHIRRNIKRYKESEHFTLINNNNNHCFKIFLHPAKKKK